MLSAYWLIVLRIPDPEAWEGILHSLSIVFLLACLLICIEFKGGIHARPLNWMTRMGTFPLTLYFSQQIGTVLAIKYQLSWRILGWPIADWLIHTLILVTIMYAATFLLKRWPFLSVEYWLRKAEKIILNKVPNKGVFQNTMGSATMGG